MSRGIGTLVSVLSSTLDELRAATLDDASVGELAEALVEVDRVAQRLRREQARLVVRFDALGAASLDGLPTTASWLRTRTSASRVDFLDAAGAVRAQRDVAAVSSIIR